MKAYEGVDVYIHIFLTWRLAGQLHSPDVLSPVKSLWYPLDRRLCGTQSLSGRRGEVTKHVVLILNQSINALLL
jgi:hypothetical protein